MSNPMSKLDGTRVDGVEDEMRGLWLAQELSGTELRDRADARVSDGREPPERFVSGTDRVGTGTVVYQFSLTLGMVHFGIPSL